MKYLRFCSSKRFIVFLHGWGASKESFLFTKDYFCEYSKVYIDFAGFGESGEPDKVFCLSDYVAELKKLIDTFEIDELVLVGHSFGGRVAIKFAYLFQNEYKKFKICLVDSAGIKPRWSLKKYLKIKKYKRLKKKAEKDERLNDKLLEYGSSDYKKLSPIMKQTFVKIVNEDLTNVARFVECKVCLIWGQDDKETKLYMAKKLFKLMRGSELYIFKNAGHFSFLDKPQEFLIILDTFIKN